MRMKKTSNRDDNDNGEDDNNDNEESHSQFLWRPIRTYQVDCQVQGALPLSPLTA